MSLRGEFGRSNALRFTDHPPSGLTEAERAERLTRLEQLAFNLAMDVRIISTDRQVDVEFRTVADQLVFRDQWASLFGQQDYVYTYSFPDDSADYQRAWICYAREALEESCIPHVAREDGNTVEFILPSMTALYMFTMLVDSGFFARTAEASLNLGMSPPGQY